MTDIKLRVREPKFINEMTNMEAIEEGVEGFDDIEDETTTAITNGFDFTQPLNECNLVAGLIFSSKRKMEDDEYVSDELDNLGPNESDEEKGKGQKFEKFTKEQLNKVYQFKHGMGFKSLDDFRDAIREWSILNGKENIFMKNESGKCRMQG